MPLLCPSFLYFRVPVIRWNRYPHIDAGINEKGVDTLAGLAISTVPEAFGSTLITPYSRRREIFRVLNI